MAESGGMPTPEQLAEQIRALKVDDILLATVTTLGQLAYAKLEARQLDQARLAIDGIAALLPVLEGAVDPQVTRDYNQLLANVRLAFASAVSSGTDTSEGQGTEGLEESDEPADDATGDGEGGDAR